MPYRGVDMVTTRGDGGEAGAGGLVAQSKGRLVRSCEAFLLKNGGGVATRA